MKTRPKILTTTEPPKIAKTTKKKPRVTRKTRAKTKPTSKREEKPPKKVSKAIKAAQQKEKDKQVSQATTAGLPETVTNTGETSKDTRERETRISVPDVLHTEDGSTFYPCKNCCRAFAKRVDLHKHQIFCRNSGVKHAPPTTSGLPLNSVENTMNSPTSKASELNNNKNHEVEPLELSYNLLDKRLKTPGSSGGSQEKSFEKNLLLDVLPNSIHRFDMKNKLKICRALNAVLENNGFTMTVMGNGDVVLKMHSSEYPPLEFITKIVPGEDTLAPEKMQLVLRPLKEWGKNHKDLEWEMPDIIEVLETTFGPDVIVNTLLDSQDVRNGNDEVLLQIDEEHFPTDDQVMSMAGMDGTIVLEDLDIHICKQCGAVYHTLQDLIAHDKYDHRKLKRKYSLEELEKFSAAFKADVEKKCPICGIQLKGNGEWPRHAQSHCEVGMFECTVCKMRFTRDDHRKNHEGRHIIKK